MGTAACRVRPVMSPSVELVAVRVTVIPVSVCLSVCSFRVTPFFSYTVTLGGAMETKKKKKFCHWESWNSTPETNHH